MFWFIPTLSFWLSSVDCSAGSREIAAKAATMTSTESANKLSLLFYLSDNNTGTFPTEIDLLVKLQVLL